jgi:hypothetical protein
MVVTPASWAAVATVRVTVPIIGAVAPASTPSFIEIAVSMVPFDHVQ